MKNDTLNCRKMPCDPSESPVFMQEISAEEREEMEEIIRQIELYINSITVNEERSDLPTLEIIGNESNLKDE